MSSYSGTKQELEKIYLRVVEKFPEIKKEDIKVKYYPKGHGFASINLIYYPRLFSKNFKMGGTITAKDLFFTFNTSMQEASIAHELGHYKNSAKRLNPNRIRRKIRWQKKAKDYKELSRNKRLRQWSILQEIYADNQATEKGYGAPILAYLKIVLEKFSSFPKDYYKSMILTEMATARINNLEKILKTKG